MVTSTPRAGTAAARSLAVVSVVFLSDDGLDILALMVLVWVPARRWAGVGLAA
jgi:hypothetical protein